MEESISFLYKLTEGACPKSYGFNVAQLAGLPSNIISLAKRKAIVCEKEAHEVRMLRYSPHKGWCINICDVSFLRKLLRPNFKISNLRTGTEDLGKLSS